METKETTGVNPETKSEETEAHEASARPSLGHRMASFARQHPRVSLLTAAGVAVFAVPQLALGALLGAGATVLATRRDGSRLQEEAADVRDRAGGRLRDALLRAEILGNELRDRARAMVLAARGQRTEPRPGGGDPTQPPG
jgi:hypothetical protein